MSRYLVNKFIYRVDRNEEMLKAYMKDPAGFVARWEKEQGPMLNESEQTSGHRFTGRDSSSARAGQAASRARSRSGTRMPIAYLFRKARRKS